MPAPVRTPDTAPPLIFQWKRERGVKRRLAMWVLMVTAGHAALFYLFRVSPPLVSRKPPPQQSVLYLPSSDPLVQDLFTSLEERYPGALLKSEDHDLKADMAALAKATPAAVPSWDAHRAVLKPFPQPLVPQELPPLLQPGEPLLPAVASPPALAPPPGGKAVRSPFVAIEGGAGPPVARQPSWPDKLMDDTWPTSGSVPFMLGLDRYGRPDYCLPLSPATGLDLEALRRALLTMRFSPPAGGRVAWVSVAVRW